MGHREDLLAGAKKLLLEKGYARTTARDIVKASGTNLASIGYHYGSKEALLNQALISAIEDWGEQLRKALVESTAEEAGPIERFEAVWTRITDSFGEHGGLWAANFEVFAQIDRVPELRESLAEGLERARRGLAEMFQDLAPDGDPYALGAFYQALLTGVMAQWLVDPEHAPTGRDLGTALRAIINGVGETSLHPVGTMTAKSRV